MSSSIIIFVDYLLFVANIHFTLGWQTTWGIRLNNRENGKRNSLSLFHCICISAVRDSMHCARARARARIS